MATGNKEQIIHLIDENYYQIEKLLQQKIKIWEEHVLFSGLWWLGVGLSIVPWIVWIVFRKKQSSDRILYSGFFVIVVALVLDVLGDQFGLWHYRFNVIPLIPTYFPWDVTLMPVSVMFLLQIKPKVNPLIKAILFALVTSYVAEPIIHFIKIYEPDKWQYTYSVPIQIIIYLSAHYISRRNYFSSI